MARRYDARKFIANPRKCVLDKHETFGDRRYRYKNWWCLSPAEKAAARGRYRYNTPGIPDSAYAYPIDAKGRLASARRTLIWSRQHVLRKVKRG